jgi:hypothetical protein
MLGQCMLQRAGHVSDNISLMVLLLHGCRVRALCTSGLLYGLTDDAATGGCMFAIVYYSIDGLMW